MPGVICLKVYEIAKVNVIVRSLSDLGLHTEGTVVVSTTKNHEMAAVMLSGNPRSH